MTASRADAVSARQGAWHQSTLETLLDGCSWQYALTFEVDAPTLPKFHGVGGTAHHAGVEAWLAARQADPTADLPLADLVAVAQAKLDEDIDDIPTHHYPLEKKAATKNRPASSRRLTADDLRERVTRSLTNWYEVATKNEGVSLREWLTDYEVLDIEPYFRLGLVEGARPVGGWMDLLLRDPATGEVFVYDHKTAGDFSRWSYDGHEHRHQATMYAVACLVEHRHGLTTLPRVVFGVARANPTGGKAERARIVHYQPKLRDVAELGQRIRDAEHKVATKSYVRDPSWALCSATYCPFYARCVGTGELARPLTYLLSGNRSDPRHGQTHDSTEQHAA